MSPPRLHPVNTMRFQALCIQNGVRLANNRLKHVDVRTLHLGETRMPRRGCWLACQSRSAGAQASACSHCTIRACTWYQSSPKQCEHGTCHQSLREQRKCEAAFACDHKWLSTQRHSWHHNKYRLENGAIKVVHDSIASSLGAFCTLCGTISTHLACAPPPRSSSARHPASNTFL